MMSYHLKDGRYWFWAIYENQDGRHRTFYMYATETPCFEILSYVIKNTNGINIGLTS